MSEPKEAEASVVRTRTSEDGVTYACLATPSRVSIKTLSYGYHSELRSADGFPVHHLYVPCSELKGTLLPLDANPREPRRTEQVKEMQLTLQSTPQDFVKKNNGLTLLARKIQFDKASSRCTLEFNAGEGVCNGGHTYFAILTTAFELDARATVHLEVIQIPEELPPEKAREEVTRIAQARNNNNKLALSSQADYLGYYGNLKRGIDPRLVSWHEGDSTAYPDAIQAEHFIRLLTSLDPTQCFHPIWAPNEETHKKLAGNVGSVHTRWYEKMERARTLGEPEPLSHMAVFGEDLFSIRDMVAYSLLNDNLGPGVRKTNFYEYLAQTLGKGKPGKPATSRKRKLRSGPAPGEEGLDIPPPTEVLLTGLFRSNVWLNLDPTTGGPSLVGWIVPPQELWNSKKQYILEALAQYFKDFNAEPVLFIRATFPYEKDLYVLGTDQGPPPPAIVYDPRSGTKFWRVSEGDNRATHWIDPEGRGLIPLTNEASPDGAPLYVQV